MFNYLILTFTQGGNKHNKAEVKDQKEAPPAEKAQLLAPDDSDNEDADEIITPQQLEESGDLKSVELTNIVNPHGHQHSNEHRDDDVESVDLMNFEEGNENGSQQNKTGQITAKNEV